MTHLLDATAVIDLVTEGPGHAYVASLFPTVQISAVNWLEVLRWSQQQLLAPEDWAQDLIAYGLDSLVVVTDDDLARQVADLVGIHIVNHRRQSPPR